MPGAVRPVALTIAGSDPTGGAGIQADLVTFAAFGVQGASALTALTAQDTRGVRDVLGVARAMVEAQIGAILGDLGVRAAKTGMLHGAEIVAAVVDALGAHPLPLVVDPVVVASSGAVLLDAPGLEALRTRLLPLAMLVTPNLAEAALLTGEPVRNRAEMASAARALVALGARAALVTGGHLSGDAVDVLWDGHVLRELAAPRVPGEPVHGTGCALSAAITAGLARGRDLETAVTAAKRFVTRAIAAAERVGAGARRLDLRVPADDA
jgi:hydroxymethylpyrimidine/phosphomethylpyrimidine kinase